MAAGDRYRATIIVYETGSTTCGGGREFCDEKTATNLFDEADLESMELIPPELPAYIGARVQVFPYRASGNANSFIAMLSAGGRWVTTWNNEFRELTAEQLSALDWELYG